MFSTDGQLVLIWILQMHFWGMLITKSLFFMNTKFMSLTYLLLLCSFMDNSLSQTTRLWVLVSAIQLFHKWSISLLSVASWILARILALILARILALFLVYLSSSLLLYYCNIIAIMWDLFVVPESWSHFCLGTAGHHVWKVGEGEFYFCH